MRASKVPALSWFQSLFLVMALAISLPAAAELSALVQDMDDGSLRAASIDSGDGSVTVGTEAIADCCLVGAGLTTVDEAGERFFAFGRYSSGDNAGEPVIMNLGFDGNNATLVDPGAELQGVLAWDGAQQRLVSAQFASVTPERSLQWVSIDPASGAVTPIGAVQTDCCELLSGLAAVDGASQQLYFIGRDFAENDWQLMGVDLATGNVSTLAAMPAGRPGFLALDEGTGELDVLIQGQPAAPSELHRIDPTSGNVSLVASQSDPDCCLVTPGATASLDQDGQFWWLAGSGSGLVPSPGFLALSAAGSSGSVQATPLVGNYRLHAMVVSGSVVNLDIIFRDRFEP